MPDDPVRVPSAGVDLGAGAGGRTLLRFLTCGSVDDGKSTLIGHLLYATDGVMGDQLETLKAESRRFGTTGDEIDFSLLLDGLEDERQQRITIDVAYRYFTTPRRSFIVADSPGHEQYTRNMATGASGADLAVLLVDARKGMLTQTRRHSFICCSASAMSCSRSTSSTSLASIARYSIRLRPITRSSPPISVSPRWSRSRSRRATAII
jgi:bifunctional enzyme CysN/CysC